MENYSNYSIDNIEHNWEKFYRLKEGDIYVEVGTFIGRYGLIAKKRKCSKIILVEPSPSNAKILEVNMNDANVIIIKKAISDEKGNTTFCCGGDFNGHRMTNIKDPCRSCWSMDWILNCEGCEYCLIKGAKKYLVSGKIKNIALAIYHVNGNIQQEIINTLNSYGFKDLMFDREVVYGHI